MKVQRSIGKKILSVAAGVGLAAGSMVAIAPAASADTWIVTAEATASKEGQPSQTQVCGYGEDQSAPIARNKAERDCDRAYQLNGFTITTKVTGGYWVTDEDYKPDTEIGDLVAGETSPPPPCWESVNNCPVGGAIQAAVPQYMIAGVPQQLVVYAAWRPDENTAGAPT
ncbi:MAG: hypothetical protein WBH19_08750, partial [Candidatus Nanopelagicales bacterium]